MHNHRRMFVLLLVFLAPFVFHAPSMVYAIPTVDSTGQLTGATGVIINNTAYDVEFREGSCDSIFMGCNPSQFTFSTEQDAQAAAQALLDSVLVDTILGDFDTDPELTFGCTSSILCEVSTPYRLAPASSSLVSLVIVENYAPFVIPDRTRSDTQTGTRTTVGDAFEVYAQYTPSAVPEPASLLLLSTGLLGLAGYRWHQRRREGT